MSDPDSSTPDTADDTVPGAIPWWESKVIRRLVLSLVVQLLAVTHLSKSFASADLTVLVDDLLEFIGMAYAAWAIHARATKPLPPVTLTRKAAAQTPTSQTPSPPK